MSKYSYLWWITGQIWGPHWQEGITDTKVSEQDIEHQSSMYLGDTKSAQSSGGDDEDRKRGEEVRLCKVQVI